MQNIRLFISVMVFNLAILFSLASVGNLMYRKIVASDDYDVATKVAFVVLITIFAFLILLFVLDMAITMVIYM